MTVISLHGSAFQPHEVSLLAQASDIAWKKYLGDKNAVLCPDEQQRFRRKIVRRVVFLAGRGEKTLTALVDYALS